MNQFKNIIGDNLIYIYIVGCIIVVALWYVGSIEKENFTDMPTPKISEIDSTIEGENLVNFHVKSAYDPLIGEGSLMSTTLSLGNANYKQSIDNLKYVLSRGVRGLCFSVIYNGGTPVVTAGKMDVKGNFNQIVTNTIEFEAVMLYLKQNATKKSNDIYVPNFNDPLFIILKIHSPKTENEKKLVYEMLRRTFNTEMKMNGEYITYNPNIELLSLKNKVCLILQNEGSYELHEKLQKMSFSSITEFNNKTITNSLLTTSHSLAMTIPINEDLQNKTNCNQILKNYFDMGIQFIAMNYKIEGDSSKTCTFKYEQKFATYKRAFIKRNTNIYKNTANSLKEYVK